MDHLTAYQKVQLARHPQRPYFLDYVEHLCPDFLEVHGEQPLIQTFFRREHRLVAEQDRQKFERRNMAADHHEADCQRRRENESDRPPQRSPERRGDHDGNGRKARAARTWSGRRRKQATG